MTPDGRHGTGDEPRVRRRRRRARGRRRRTVHASSTRRARPVAATGDFKAASRLARATSSASATCDTEGSLARRPRRRLDAERTPPPGRARQDPGAGSAGARGSSRTASSSTSRAAPDRRPPPAKGTPARSPRTCRRRPSPPSRCTTSAGRQGRRQDATRRSRPTGSVDQVVERRSTRSAAPTRSSAGSATRPSPSRSTAATRRRPRRRARRRGRGRRGVGQARRLKNLVPWPAPGRKVTSEESRRRDDHHHRPRRSLVAPGVRPDAQASSGALKSMRRIAQLRVHDGLAVVGVGGDDFVKAVLDTKAGSSLADQARLQDAPRPGRGRRTPASVFVDVAGHREGRRGQLSPAAEQGEVRARTSSPTSSRSRRSRLASRRGDLSHVPFVVTVDK